MGRNIHWQVEYCDRGTWYWLRSESKYARFVYSWQSYKMFDLLAGAGRGELLPIVPARGLPDDISKRLLSAYRTEFDGKVCEQWRILGGHSHSWLTYAELRQEEAFWDQHCGEVPYRVFAHDLLCVVLPCMEMLLTDRAERDYSPGDLAPHELRAVFGFSD